MHEETDCRPQQTTLLLPEWPETLRTFAKVTYEFETLRNERKGLSAGAHAHEYSSSAGSSGGRSANNVGNRASIKAIIDQLRIVLRIVNKEHQSNQGRMT